MSKLTITEAVKIIPVSESTLRRDVKNGTVSCHKDDKGRNRFEVAELERVYGQLKSLNGTQPPAERSDPEPTHQNLSMNGNDTSRIIDLLEGQVQDLKDRLSQADTEKTQLLALADRLQKQNEVLMLPPPKKSSFWGYFRLRK